jgi:protein SCO1/2
VKPFVPLFIATVLLTACSTRPGLPSYGVVPDFKLTDQSGRPFTGKKLEGKVWVANFIFTTCAGPCPRMTGQMRDLRDKSERMQDVRLVSFTIDPARDTPEVLSEYGRRYGADPDRWYFLTGPQAELHKLKRYAFKLGNVDGSLEHSTRFVLVDRKSRIRGYYDSSDQEKMQQLLADVTTVVEAGA